MEGERERAKSGPARLMSSYNPSRCLQVVCTSYIRASNVEVSQHVPSNPGVSPCRLTHPTSSLHAAIPVSPPDQI